MNSMKDNYIDKIDYYQDLLKIVRDKHEEWDTITEYDSVYQDILDYQDNEFEDWSNKDFEEFIKYLKELIVVGLEV